MAPSLRIRSIFLGVLVTLSSVVTGCTNTTALLSSDNTVDQANHNSDSVELIVATQNKYAPNRIPNLFITQVEQRYIGPFVGRPRKV